jgi:uncharacterized protein YbjQ (UPF0145 family)
MLAVTIETLPGFEIKEVLGQVVGVVARPRNAYVEGVKSLTGKAPSNVADALVRAREVAIAHMLRIAYQRGANAVVGMRFDHRPVSESWNEICAYGTAVFVIPAPEPALSGLTNAASETGEARRDDNAAGAAGRSGPGPTIDPPAIAGPPPE